MAGHGSASSNYDSKINGNRELVIPQSGNNTSLLQNHLDSNIIATKPSISKLDSLLNDSALPQEINPNPLCAIPKTVDNSDEETTMFAERECNKISSSRCTSDSEVDREVEGILNKNTSKVTKLTTVAKPHDISPSTDGESDKDANDDDDDDEEEDEIDEDDTDVSPVSQESEEQPPAKRKRTASKKGKEDKKKKKSKKNYERKNIRKILSDDKLAEDTINAQQEEKERQQRLADLKRTLLAQQALQQNLGFQGRQFPPNVITQAEKKKECPQLKGLLEASDGGIQSSVPKDPDVIELSSDEDDDVVMMAEQQGEFDDDDNEDPNNSGAHINDAHNRPDEQGRVMVNVGHPPDEPPVYLAPQLSRAVKPHQIGGIRFLYDNLVESIERYKISNGFGCILAHSMGLGKTIQVISFIDVFLRTTEAKRVLCIVPVNTLQNWVGEFNMWLPDKKCLPDDTPEQEVLPRQFNIHIINDTHKTPYSRAAVVENWYKIGGVLLLGYEMYRLLTSRRIIKKRMSKKKAHLPVVIDLEEEDRNQELIVDMQACLVTPGPDLIICDEGHRIKNAHASISQALKNIQTRRRVVLTGYPLQNNLIEYWCMVDFVRPSFLGNKTEFANMFERPITNGQCADATDQDKRLMKFRAHVLHSLLEGFVQRRGHAVLRSSLPVKHEYVLMVRMSPIQRKLYNRFMEVIEDPNMFGNNPLKAFAVCCKIWNHPDIIQEIVKAHKENDFDLDLDEGSRSNDGTAKKKTAATKSPKSQSPYFPGMEGLEPPPGLFGPEKSDGRITYEWAEDLLRNYVRGDINNGGKMQLLLNILEESVMVGDKMLLFSQSLFTLNLIEEYLGKSEVPLTNDKWAKNRNYFRLDGSTSASERDKLINQFNDPQNTNVQLFLLSTRAGCLGINLIGANRVIIFDASWNPCHDCQAVCRVYRYGQTKETFVYRFVTDNTLERRIYERQINKQGMSDRVVDELNPQNHFTKKQVETLLQYQDVELPLINFNNFDGVCHDPLLLNVLKRDGHWITKEPFTHESLLVDNKEQKLTKSEKRLAKQGYEYEKKMNTTYSRPSYSTWYPKTSTGANPNLNISRSTMPGLAGRLPSRHIPSVKPLQSAPIPMQPSFSDSGPPINVQSLQRPGVHVQQIITTTDITIPGTTSSTTSGPQKVPAGSQVLVIKTPRGVYIRTGQGKIFAVRSAPNSKGDSTPPLGGATGSTTSTTTTYSDGDSLASSGDRPLSLTTNSSKSKSMLTNLLEQSSGIRDMMNGVSNEEKSADGQSPSSDLKNYDDTPKSEQIINHQTLSGGETIVAPSVTQHKKQHPFDMDSLLSQQQTGNGDSSQPHSSHADGGDMYSKYDNMRNSPFGGFPSNPYSFPGFSNPLPPSYPYPQNVPLPPWPGFPQSIPSTDTKQTPEKK